MHRDLKNLEPVMHVFKNNDEYKIWLGDQSDNLFPYVTFFIEKNDEKHVVGCGQIEYDDNDASNLLAAVDDSFLELYGMQLEDNELTRISDFLRIYVTKYHTAISRIKESKKEKEFESKDNFYLHRAIEVSKQITKILNDEGFSYNLEPLLREFMMLKDMLQ